MDLDEDVSDPFPRTETSSALGKQVELMLSEPCLTCSSRCVNAFLFWTSTPCWNGRIIWGLHLLSLLYIHSNGTGAKQSPRAGLLVSCITKMIYSQAPRAPFTAFHFNISPMDASGCDFPPPLPSFVLSYWRKFLQTIYFLNVLLSRDSSAVSKSPRSRSIVYLATFISNRHVFSRLYIGFARLLLIQVIINI